jgi:site-specific DNA-cytosine methylase
MVAEWMAESNQAAMAIARINCPSVNKQYASAFEVDPASLPWVHVIMGGTCCQPFSRIGKRLGWADDRAYTTLRLLHIAVTQRNWFAVMENVAEILVAHDGRVWKLIRFVLESEGFHVQAVHTNPCY